MAPDSGPTITSTTTAHPPVVGNSGMAIPPPEPQMSPELLKVTYLQLLPHPVLVRLVLALDKDPDAKIFPANLPEAIDSLREYAKRLYASKAPVAPIAPTALPPSVGPRPGQLPPGMSSTPNPTVAAASSATPVSSITATSIPTTAPIPRHLPTQIAPRPLIPPPPHPHSHALANSLAHSNFHASSSKTPSTSTAPYPYTTTAGTYSGPQQPARLPLPKNATGRPPNGPGSGGMPSYEEMIVVALEEIQEPEGLAPKTVFEYMSAHWPLMNNFRPSASQALQKAYKRGRLEKIGGKYRLNPAWEGGNTSKRATRRPQVGDTDTATQPPASNYAFPWSRPTVPPSSAPTGSYGSKTAAKYPVPPARPGAANPFQPNSRAGAATARGGGKGKGKVVVPIPTPAGKTAASKLAHAISSNGGHGKLVAIKQEDDSEEEDEEGDELESEDENDADEDYGRGVMQPPPAPNLSLKETLRKLAQLLKESAEAGSTALANDAGSANDLG